MVELEARRQSIAARSVWWIAALIPLLLGFALRLHYLLQAEPFVDEPTTLLVAQAIARTGLPILPSGLLYGNDPVFSYLAGALVAALGTNLAVIRALSLGASLATLALVYLVGRRAFAAPGGEGVGTGAGLASPWIGLWAALFLALSPEAIVWGTRARAYALLQLLAFLAAWLFYLGVAEGRPGLRRLGLLLLAVAVYVHPEAALLLPALVAGVVVVAGWQWWLRPDRLIELVLAAAAVGSRFWWQMVLATGRIGGFDTPTGSRPPIELFRDLPARVRAVSPFFLEGERLVWTLLALLALAAALWAAARARQAGAWRPILFFSACLWLVPLGMILALGSSYQSPRYLSLLLPLFALLAAAGLQVVVAGLARLGRQYRLRRAVAVLGLATVATVALVVPSAPGALAASNSREKGFRSAFEYVAAHRQAGDRVATVAPAYCQLVLDHCDLFTLGLEYEEFVYRGDDGGWHDRWLGLPLVSSAGELDAALAGGGRLWFVTDEGRLRTRFQPAFAQMVWQRMELVAKVDGVMVFVEHDAPGVAVSRAVDAIFGGQIALSGYDLGVAGSGPSDPAWGEVVARPGQALSLTLYWQAAGAVSGDYVVFVHLLGADGERYAQIDGPPLRGLQPTTHWLAGETLPDRWVLDLPAGLAPGRYRLVVGLYERASGDRLPVTGAGGRPLGDALSLDYVQVPPPGEALPSPAWRVDVDLTGEGDAIRLLGYSLPSQAVAPGGSLDLVLYWQAPAPVRADYTVFVHLLSPGDEIRGQGDGPPVGDTYPTSFWDPGEIVVDEHQVSIDADAPAGRYRLAVGLYLPSGRRLASAEGDRVFLAQVEVGP
jgi:4-amino-4-deoxy-L-arabinose transferase-like glycosyltransferase